MKYFFRLIQIFAFIIFSTAVYSDDSDQLKKLQELLDGGVLTEEQFNDAKSKLDIKNEKDTESLKDLQKLLDSGVLTEEQFNDAKSKLDSKGKVDGQKLSGVYEYFGVTLGGIIDIENQTIEGKPFKFESTSIGRRNYFMDDWNDRSWKENKAKSKFIWEGKKGKEKEGRFLVVHKNPDKKEKVRKVYFVEFAYVDNVARVLRVDISPWEDNANPVKCKEWSTDAYMKFYNSGKYDISEEDHRFNSSEKMKEILHGPDEDIWIYFDCANGWYWMGAEDNKLTEIHEASVLK